MTDQKPGYRRAYVAKSARLDAPVTPDVQERIDRVADDLGITRAQFVRTAVIRQLDEIETRSQK